MIRYRLVQVDKSQKKKKKKKDFGLAVCNRLSLSLRLSLSSSSYFLSFSKQKTTLPLSHRLMASTISIRGEPGPEHVNLVVRALELDNLLFDIFLHLRSDPVDNEGSAGQVHH